MDGFVGLLQPILVFEFLLNIQDRLSLTGTFRLVSSFEVLRFVMRSGLEVFLDEQILAIFSARTGLGHFETFVDVDHSAQALDLAVRTEEVARVFARAGSSRSEFTLRYYYHFINKCTIKPKQSNHHFPSCRIAKFSGVS